MFSSTDSQSKKAGLACILAAGVFIISQVLVIVSGGSEVRYALLFMIFGTAALVLCCLSWAFRKKSIPKSVACAAAALLMPGLAGSFYGGNGSNAFIGSVLLVLPMLVVSMVHRLLGDRFANGIKKALLDGALPCVFLVAVCVYMQLGPDSMSVMWIAQALIWSYALNLPDDGGTEKRRMTQYRLWLVCSGLIWTFIVFAEPYFYSMHMRYMSIALQACLPFIYVWLFRKLEEKIMRDGSGRFGVMAAGYFGAALLLCLLWAVCFGRFPNSYISASDTGIFYMLMALAVYVKESKATREKAEHTREEAGNTQKNTKGRAAAVLSGIVYICGGAGILLGVNERLRQILFMVGGPAVRIVKTARIHYLGYRLAALKSFFAGNADAIAAFAAAHPDEKLETYTYYADSCRLGGAVYRMGWWWLPVLIALVLVIVWILFRIRYEDAAKNRMKQYVLIGYLIRMVLASVLYLFLFESVSVEFPFGLYGGMDLVILYLFFIRKADAHEQSKAVHTGAGLSS